MTQRWILSQQFSFNFVPVMYSCRVACQNFNNFYFLSFKKRSDYCHANERSRLSATTRRKQSPDKCFCDTVELQICPTKALPNLPLSMPSYIPLFMSLQQQQTGNATASQRAPYNKIINGTSNVVTTSINLNQHSRKLR